MCSEYRRKIIGVKWKRVRPAGNKRKEKTREGKGEQGKGNRI